VQNLELELIFAVEVITVAEFEHTGELEQKNRHNAVNNLQRADLGRLLLSLGEVDLPAE